MQGERKDIPAKGTRESKEAEPKQDQREHCRGRKPDCESEHGRP